MDSESWLGDPPAGWVADDSFGPPDLSQSPQITCVSWSARRPVETASHARFVSACFESRIGTWSAEIEPIVLDKIAAMTLSTALRVRSDATLAPTATTRASNVATQSLEGHGARAKTSLGFVRDRSGTIVARACLRLCAFDEHGAGEEAHECAASIDDARAAPIYEEPPPAAIWLRATLAAVHHPRATLLGAVGLACALGCAAIATRRRPRRRTK